MPLRLFPVLLGKHSGPLSGLTGMQFFFSFKLSVEEDMIFLESKNT